MDGVDGEKCAALGEEDWEQAVKDLAPSVRGSSRENRKVARHYVARFNLESKFPYLASQGRGEANIAVRLPPKNSNPHAPEARLPAHVAVVDVRSAASVVRCVEAIVDSAAKERAAGRCGVLAIDVEVQNTLLAMQITFIRIIYACSCCQVTIS